MSRKCCRLKDFFCRNKSATWRAQYELVTQPKVNDDCRHCWPFSAVKSLSHSRYTYWLADSYTTHTPLSILFNLENKIQVGSSSVCVSVDVKLCDTICCICIRIGMCQSRDSLSIYMCVLLEWRWCQRSCFHFFSAEKIIRTNDNSIIIFGIRHKTYWRLALVGLLLLLLWHRFRTWMADGALRDSRAATGGGVNSAVTLFELRSIAWAMTTTGKIFFFFFLSFVFTSHGGLLYFFSLLLAD